MIMKYHFYYFCMTFVKLKLDFCIALPVDMPRIKFSKNPTFKTQVTYLRTLETLNRVFSTSLKWDLPGSSTKCFTCR